MPKKRKTRSIQMLAQPGAIQEILLRIRLVLRLIADRRVNFFLKLLPIGALAYFISPIDLMPGVVLPFIGALDDIAILGGGVYLFLEMCPTAVVAEHERTISKISNDAGHHGTQDDEVIDALSVDIYDEKS